MPVPIVDHIEICVSNMERSLAFYRDMLGFRVISDEVLDASSIEGLRYIYKNQHDKLRVAVLSCSEAEGASKIILDENPGDPTEGEPIKLDQLGISHIAFKVSNVAELTQELVARGAQTCGPADAFKDASGHVGTVFFQDPDGILLEFSEGGVG